MKEILSSRLHTYTMYFMKRFLFRIGIHIFKFTMDYLFTAYRCNNNLRNKFLLQIQRINNQVYNIFFHKVLRWV